MSGELASKIAQLEGQIRQKTAHIEVLTAELQEKVSHGVAYRTNLHLVQKAYQEMSQEKTTMQTKINTLEVTIKELEEKLKPHLVTGSDEPEIDAA